VVLLHFVSRVLRISITFIVLFVLSVLNALFVLLGSYSLLSFTLCYMCLSPFSWISLSVTHPLFHSMLESRLFHKSFVPWPDCIHRLGNCYYNL